MPKITEIFAFIAEEDGPENEGIVASVIPTLGVTPLCGADMARINSIRPLAEAAAKISGKKVKLVHFKNRVDIEEIDP